MLHPGPAVVPRHRVHIPALIAGLAAVCFAAAQHQISVSRENNCLPAALQEGGFPGLLHPTDGTLERRTVLRYTAATPASCPPTPRPRPHPSPDVAPGSTSLPVPAQPRRILPCLIHRFITARRRILLSLPPLYPIFFSPGQGPTSSCCVEAAWPPSGGLIPATQIHVKLQVRGTLQMDLTSQQKASAAAAERHDPASVVSDVETRWGSKNT